MYYFSSLSPSDEEMCKKRVIRVCIAFNPNGNLAETHEEHIAYIT